MTTIAIVRTDDRKAGIARLLDLLGFDAARGKDVLLKPNFNTADRFPGSTHNDTLRHLVTQLRSRGASGMTLGERSGPADTAAVLEEKGIPGLCRELGVRIVNFDELPPSGWVRIRPRGGSWRDGFEFAKPVLDAPCVVTTCCLKTHGYGAVFTMSLKLSIGMVRKRDMSRLHASLPSMQKMIAEVNTAYSPALVVMDALEAFTDGGPMTGTRKNAGVLVAGTDRVAVDAVGLAILKDLGSNRAIMDTRIFEQEQISRAVELGLGVKGPGEIQLVTDDEAGKAYAGTISGILTQG